MNNEFCGVEGIKLEVYSYSMTNDIGLARGTVKLFPYNPAWRACFEAEAKQLQRALNIIPEHIQHVGSTAIPGIFAKPIIDIAILVDSLDRADQWAMALGELGYWNKGPQPDMPERRFFAKGPEDKRTVYLHLVTSAEFGRLIHFRDTLRSNSVLVKQYSDIKKGLATCYPNDRAIYTKQKDSFIQDVLGRDK